MSANKPKSGNQAVSLVQHYVQENCDVPQQRWEHLNELYTTITDEIIRVMEANTETIRKVTALGYADEKFNMVVQQMCNDTERLFAEAEEIREKHTGRAGTVSREDYFTYISVGENYRIFGQRSLNCVMSASLTAMDEYNRIASIMAKVKKDEGDVNVITDVRVKDSAAAPAEPDETSATSDQPQDTPV